MRRYYALLLYKDGKARLVKVLNDLYTLQKVDLPLQFNVKIDLELKVEGQQLQGWVNGVLLFDVVDNDDSLEGGAAALLVEVGTVSCEVVEID